MLQAMLAGVASIKAQQMRMNVIGNNLANINTTAYKGSRVTFQDMIAQTIRGATRPSAGGGLGGTNPTQLGLGVTVGGTDVNQEQGSLNATNRPTDLAIQGFGFFMVGNGSNISYTRDGSFDLDANGDLVSRSTGQKLLGWRADALGNLNTTDALNGSSSINIPVGVLNAVQATSKVDFAGNLDATALPSDEVTTQAVLFDGLGNEHHITVRYYNHQVPPGPGAPPGATSSWDWQAFEGPAGTGTPIGDSTTAGNSPFYFNDQGSQVVPTNATVIIPASNGASPLSIQLNFTQVNQLSTSSQVNSIGQNGFPPGSLASFSIGGDGVITGAFTNGFTRALGQIAMSVFPNGGGLERVGSNLWRDTDNSGLPVVGVPRTGGRGSISAGFLEQSNVDIGNEFSDLIVTQRGFQANTKVVTTVDEMMQDLINMKR